MREVAPIPRDALLAFKKQNDLTVKKMAFYFGVKCPTMEGWLYKYHIQNMSREFCDRVMRKLQEENVSVSEPVFIPPADINLPPISAAINGDMDDCWFHYASEICPHDEIKEKKILIGYTRVQEVTAKRWLALDMPEGQNLLRLRCFLGHRGYGVAELDTLNAVLKALAYVIADWKIRIAEVIDRMGYKQQGTLLQVLLGHAGMSDERLDICRAIVAEHAIDAAGHRAVQTHAVTQPLGLSLQEETQEPSLLPVRTSADGMSDSEEMQWTEESPAPVISDEQQTLSPMRRANGARQWQVENLAALVRLMLPLAQYVLSDACTDHDRERVRALTNGDGVFLLSRALNGLCGPRVRTHMTKMKKYEGEQV